jgi:hypothetical protein
MWDRQAVKIEERVGNFFDSMFFSVIKNLNGCL